ncbi:MAG: hypothetical protein HY909_04780 [Deltaproteobacteria bacterium]|nr:hypothetical protein [Deltaproteobacteria bacterium]
MRFLSALLDVRRTRPRRSTLVLLALAALVLPLLARLAPSTARYLCPPGLVSALLGAWVLVAAAAARWTAGQDPHWTLADDLSWVIALTAFGLLGALGGAPVTVPTVLHGLTALLLAVRVPPGRVLVAGAATAALGPLTRRVAGFSGDQLWPLVFVSAFVVVLLGCAAWLASALAYVLSERDSLTRERRARPRPASVGAVAEAPPEDERASSREETTPVPEAPPTDEVGWEGLVERLRVSLSNLCDAAGVAASVQAEVRGLAPPSSKLRASVLKITQEAAGHALRDAAPTSILVTLRRGEGGLLLEVQDDGRGGEAQRARRSLAALRGRVVPLGGSAELRRGDAGWVVRVRLPCEQLN